MINTLFALLHREIKERIKKTKDEKKAKKAELTKSQKTQSKGNVPKGGAASKGPKLGGGGGKRWFHSDFPCRSFFLHGLIC